MPDSATLARYALCARRALAEAHTATLLVEGLGRVSPDPDHTLLHDIDGRPRFTCAATSPIAAAAAARCPAILDVVAAGSALSAVSSAPPVTGSVIFAGHLALGTSDTDQDTPAGTCVVELHLVSVIVEVDDPQSHALVARQVPLHVYTGGSARTLTAAAETMRLHTNARHADRLRSCAAARAGIADGQVIEARLVEVDPDGAQLEWLDADGGHVVRLGFPRVATDGPELAALLRAQLAAHRSSR